MIYYKPITDKQQLRKRFPQKPINDSDVCGAYIGFDDSGNNVGSCYINTDGYKCYLSDVSCDLSDKLLVEGFVRAALNFGANRNAYMAYCNQENISDVLLMLGFEKNGDLYGGDIPTLLQGSCCK
ncbi:MAG: hypothetical protein J1F23_01650 [Oscillospiraceae bacterium]|nr:hypothetical protein [Oscillospiraceae bacterium]